MPPRKKARKSTRPPPDGGHVSSSAGTRRLSATTLPLGTPIYQPDLKPPRADPLEVVVHRVDTGPALSANINRVVEVWTKHRIYTLDAQLNCVEVIDLASGQPDPRHPFLHSRLVGGQSHHGRGHELTLPYPTPGSDAVFQGVDGKGRPIIQLTSAVSRVVLHIRLVRVGASKAQQTWSDLTQSGM
jgi:hypothetical protein